VKSARDTDLKTQSGKQGHEHNERLNPNGRQLKKMQCQSSSSLLFTDFHCMVEVRTCLLLTPSRLKTIFIWHHN